MKPENTLNEQELRDAVYERLTAKDVKMSGKPITAKIVDDILDESNDVVFEALVNGNGVKTSGIGSLEIREHKESAYKVPKRDENNVVIPGEFLTGTTPAGQHVFLETSDKLLDALNA